MPFSTYLQHTPAPAPPPVEQHPLQFELPSFLLNPPPESAAQYPYAFTSFTFPNKASLDTNDLPEPQPDQPQRPLPLAAPFPFPPPSANDRPPPSPTQRPQGGLSIYSASGFDMLSVLSRVASRPSQQLMLGPVDMTCSFVVVDPRKFDSPIVYASPQFCSLTGYTESEILGRNCRFLQSPLGQVSPNEKRLYTAPDAVAHLKTRLGGNQECQVSLRNYRKDGTPFDNLVTVVPITKKDDPEQVEYHVGFQIDLGEQPQAILQRMRNGTYVVNYSQSPNSGIDVSLSAQSPAMSEKLSEMLRDPAFRRVMNFTHGTNAIHPLMDTQDLSEQSQFLNLMFLEHGPDFIHVLSLKGYFLYVSPSVRDILGYEPEDLVGKSITDFCHPADSVPITRELKESSALPPGTTGPNGTNGAKFPAAMPQPKTVDLLFRAMTKSGKYVWLECLGRLYVETGKGRKAIILSGRARPMPTVDWAHVRQTEKEFWGVLSAQGTFLVAGAGVKDLLGYGAGEMIGRGLGEFVGEGYRALMDALSGGEDMGVPVEVNCGMKRRDGEVMRLVVVVHPSRVCQFMNVEEGDKTEGEARNLCRVPTSQQGGSDVFEEFEESKGTSWQYELQRLKFMNTRLKEEVAALESFGAGSSANGSSPGGSGHPYSHTGTIASESPPLGSGVVACGLPYPCMGSEQDVLGFRPQVSQPMYSTPISSHQSTRAYPPYEGGNDLHKHLSFRSYPSISVRQHHPLERNTLSVSSLSSHSLSSSAVDLDLFDFASNRDGQAPSPQSMSNMRSFQTVQSMQSVSTVVQRQRATKRTYNQIST